MLLFELCLLLLHVSPCHGQICDLIRMKEGMHYHAITDAVGRFLRERAQAKGVSLQNMPGGITFLVPLSSSSNLIVISVM